MLGRLATIRDQMVGNSTNTASDIARYDYDAVGNLTSLERGNGVDTTYSFDEQNCLKTLDNKRGTSVLSSFGYTLRGDGKRTNIAEQIVNADAGRVSSRSLTYAYDDAGKLTGEQGQNGLGANYENAWEYDAVGNRTSTTARSNDVAGATSSWAHETVVTSQFNANDQLTSQTSVVDGASTVTQNYTYDENGAEKTVASKSGNAASGSSVNGWDFEGKLRTTQAKDAEGADNGGSSNAFDANGDRLWHVADVGKPSQKTTSYVVDTDTSYAQVVEESSHDVNDGAGTSRLQARYVWGQGLAPLAMWRRGGDGAFKLFYFVSDGQDSVRQLTDTAGAVTDSYFYDAWGQSLAGGSGSTANPFRYTGQQLDSDGRYYLRARFYDPGNGRFLSHDPLMGMDEDPVSMHRYLYAGTDGVNGVDPSGAMTTAQVSASLVVASTLFSAAVGMFTFDKLGGSKLDGAITGARLGFAISFSLTYEPELVGNAVVSGFSNALASSFGYVISNFAKGGSANPFLHADFAGRCAIEAIKGFTTGFEAVLYGGMLVKKFGGDDLDNVNEVALGVGVAAFSLTLAADFAGGERKPAKLFTDAFAQGIYAGITTWAVGHNTSLSPAAARRGSLQISQSLVNAAAPLLSTTINVYLPWLDPLGPPDYPTG